MKKQLKLALVVIILLATIGLFVRYVMTHPEVIDKITDMSPAMILALLFFYGVSFFALALVLRVSLKMYGKTIGRQENLLLNAYSSLVNFFGPAQSGPAFRGVYLKKRHSFGVKNYIFTTLLYYAFYAIFSAFLLFVGSRPWWQTTLLMVAAAGCSLVILKWYAKRSSLKDQSGINPKTLSMMAGATALQLAALVGVYYVELSSAAPGVSFGQVLTYTGAANFALFAAITPGAIGIREAFLVFSHNLHHISNTVIVAANIIDRAAYLIVLGIMFIMVLTLHAKDKLRVRQITSEDNKSDT